MAIKVGISGFGRISRVVIRIAMSEPDIEIAGIGALHRFPSFQNTVAQV